MVGDRWHIRGTAVVEAPTELGGRGRVWRRRENGEKKMRDGGGKRIDYPGLVAGKESRRW